MTARILAALAIVASLNAVQPRSLVGEVQSSTEVAWLERLCSDLAFAEAEYADRGRNTAGVKGVRSAAYVRLGAIGTPESLAAVNRIEAQHRGQSVLPRAVVPEGWLYHAAPHMSDSRWRVTTTTLSDGRDAGAFILEFYGPPSLFVATRRDGRWSRPRLVMRQAPPFARVALREVGPDRLRAEFAPQEVPPGATFTPPQPVPDAIEFALSEVEKDVDGDGWTDVEEEYLSMNRRAADSDRDGLPDGGDSTPTLTGKSALDATDLMILRRAIFAMFGLTNAPHALFVRDESPRLQLDNLPGPVFYRNAQSGVRVTWEILSRSDSEAKVEITDVEYALAASGNEITLRRTGDQWYVVNVRMLWIS
jgi:hypothetical protein